MFANMSLLAQDIIVTSKGTKIEAKITEIGLETVKYKEFSYQDGPDYVIKKDEIASIVYSNGNVVVFFEEQTDNAQQTNNTQRTIGTQEDALTQNQINYLLLEEYKYFKSLRDKNMLDYLKDDVKTYRMFNKGRRMKIAGIVLVCCTPYAPYVGIPLLVKGIKLQKKAKDSYAKKYFNR
jgi:hypothetical protein